MIQITVIGTPGPQGSKHHVGGGVMIESSKKVAPWRQDVVAAARSSGKMVQGPVSVTMIFTLRKPKSAPKRKRAYADRKPDLDKLVRSTADALVTAGIIEDDARIVTLRAHKVFEGDNEFALTGGATGVRIFIKTPEEEIL